MPLKNRRTRSNSVRRSNRKSVRRNNRRSLRRSNRRKSLRRSNRRKSLRRSNRRRTARRNVDEKYGGALWKAKQRAKGKDYNATLEQAQAEKDKAARDKENNLRQRARVLEMKGWEQAPLPQVKSFLSKASADPATFNKAREDAESREQERQELIQRAIKAGIENPENLSVKVLDNAVKKEESRATSDTAQKSGWAAFWKRETALDGEELLAEINKLRKDIINLHERCKSYGGEDDTTTTTTPSDDGDTADQISSLGSGGDNTVSGDGDSDSDPQNQELDSGASSEKPVTQEQSVEPPASTDGSTVPDEEAAADTGEGSPTGQGAEEELTPQQENADRRAASPDSAKGVVRNQGTGESQETNTLTPKSGYTAGDPANRQAARPPSNEEVQIFSQP